MTRNGQLMTFGLLLAAAVACSGSERDTAPDTASSFPTPDGWSIVGDVLTFDSESLYQQINGAADAYLSYGFEQLRVADLSDGTHTVTVSLYEMSTPLSAFGIYRTEVPPSEAALDIGTEARMALPYQAMLLKDRFYVKVDALEGELALEWTPDLLRQLASALPGDDSLPSELSVLPDERMVANSLAYTKEGLLGLSEMTECLHATYSSQDGATTFIGFVMLPPMGGDGPRWEQLAGLETWRTETIGDTPALVRDVPYTGQVAVVQGPDGRLLGVAGGEDTESTTAYLEQLGFLSP